MEIVVSGIRPTGNLHLGNYFGAVKNFIRMQTEFNCYFFIADYHSLTTHPTPADLHASVKQVLVEYLACGLDPEKSTIYLQSDLPETAEMYLLLNMNAYLGELERSATFKEKIRTQPNNVNAGLLTYPVLMASDILIHRASKVPVGKDQEQHLEMTRNFAQRFNNMFGVDFLPEPQAFNYGDSLVKIPGLDGKGKMSKSESGMNAIFLADSDDAVRKKISKAKTDAGPSIENQQKPEEIQNLFELMKIVSSADTFNHFENLYNKCQIRYGDFKNQIAEDMIQFITPIRTRIDELSNDGSYLAKVAKNGEEKARESGVATLRTMREIIGFKKFY